jgi:hypothetical protein
MHSLKEWIPILWSKFTLSVGGAQYKTQGMLGRSSYSVIQQVVPIPNRVSYLRFHRGCYSQRLMDSHEIVMIEMQRNGTLQVVQLL